MFKIGFKEHYRVLHVNNEIGNCLVGGAGTYMNEIYRYHKPDTGFVYMNLGSQLDDFDASDYQKNGDIVVMHRDESYKLASMDFDILVVQFYEFAFCITEELKKNRKIVYVIHSVPTPEPMTLENPFGCNSEIQAKFEHLCNCADILICVSYAEQKKLEKIYPQHAHKIKVIHNGISYEGLPTLNENYKKSRKIFGYIGRTDYLIS